MNEYNFNIEEYKAGLKLLDKTGISDAYECK